jgi:NifB/MoaA-like Fe-S oxidoreductase
LRWLRLLLEHGVTVHGQIVVCPGLNDGTVLDDTLCGILDEYPELASVALVPLGVSGHNTEPRMRPHTYAEAVAVVDCVARWQETYLDVLGRRLAYAADEYYLLADRPFPPLEHYNDAPMHEDGIGMARTFEAEFEGHNRSATGPRSGFFAWAAATTAPATGERGAGAGPSNPTGYTTPATRSCGATGVGGPTAAGAGRSASPAAVRLRPRRGAPVGILTGGYAARVLAPLVAGLGRDDVRIVTVDNRFFGGNVGVAGLLVGDDLCRVLSAEPEGHRYLLPDVCLSDGRFLDGATVADLPRAVEVVPTDGIALRAALEA